MSRGRGNKTGTKPPKGEKADQIPGTIIFLSTNFDRQRNAQQLTEPTNLKVPSHSSQSSLLTKFFFPYYPRHHHHATAHVQSTARKTPRVVSHGSSQRHTDRKSQTPFFLTASTILRAGDTCERSATSPRRASRTENASSTQSQRADAARIFSDTCRPRHAESETAHTPQHSDSFGLFLWDLPRAHENHHLHTGAEGWIRK